MYLTLERIASFISFLFALLGGFVLIALTMLTVSSVSGRALIPFGLGPIPGDFELVEAGVAFAVFAFLPWFQFNRGHASVEVFTQFLPEGINLILDVLIDVLMLMVAILLCRQHALGTLDKTSYGETTFILQFPIWWAYAAALSGALVFVLVASFCLWRSVRTLFVTEPSS
ncbi:MAG: TRAP transporter small permease [Hyphomicrobiales bacterium]